MAVTIAWLGVKMRCLECGAESTGAAQVCARCGAPIGQQSFAAADRAAGCSGPGQAASAVTANAAGLTTQKPYVPGRGNEVPPGLRRVLQGYSWMACGALLCGWALLMVDAYVDNVNSTSDPRYLLSSIALGVLAAILFGQHIRSSQFLRRPRDARTATVTATQHGGRILTLDAPCNGYLSGLQVRLPWWAEPETLLPGESVTLYGRPAGAGRLLVSSSARRRAFTGTGRRRPGPRPARRPCGMSRISRAADGLGDAIFSGGLRLFPGWASPWLWRPRSSRGCHHLQVIWARGSSGQQIA